MRNEQSLHLMADSGKISYDDFIRLKHTTRALLADRMVPELIEAVGTSSDPDIQKAVAMLKGWDHQYNADSKGALLFETWVKTFAGPTMSNEQNFAQKWDANDPINTPRGIKDPAVAVSTLKAAVADTIKTYGAVDRPYGEVSRFHIGDVNIPANGGLGNLGIFRTITWGPMEERPAQGAGGRNLGLDGGVLQAGEGDGRDELRRFQPAGLEAQQRPTEIRRGAEVAHLVGEAGGCCEACRGEDGVLSPLLVIPGERVTPGKGIHEDLQHRSTPVASHSMDAPG